MDATMNKIGLGIALGVVLSTVIVLSYGALLAFGYIDHEYHPHPKVDECISQAKANNGSRLECIKLYYDEEPENK
jgi:hypothetical protein